MTNLGTTTDKETNIVTDYAQLPLVLDVDDLVNLLRISKNTVYTILRKGEIEHIRVGRKILVPKEAVKTLFSRFAS